MARVKNTKRQPLDVQVSKDVVLNLGPKGGANDTSRELSAEELESVQVKANIRAGNIIVLQTEEPAKAKKGGEK